MQQDPISYLRSVNKPVEAREIVQVMEKQKYLAGNEFAIRDCIRSAINVGDIIAQDTKG